MTDSYRVYTKVKKMLKQMMKMDHQGQVVTLAMMISGIVMSRNAQLSAMSSEIPTDTKEKSIEMRMRRWVKDDIDVEAVYMPFKCGTAYSGIGKGAQPSPGRESSGFIGRCRVRHE